MSFPYLIQGNNIVVVVGSKTHTFGTSHIAYQRVRDAIKNGDWATVADVIDPKEVILDYGQKNITVQGDKLLWKGVEMHNALATRIVHMYQEGFSVEPMVNFMENLMQNPSRRAVNELYAFLEKGELPITPDGHFLAYKKVRADYKDCHSGTMDNSVGKVVEMERNMVDDDKDRTCSAGLHFCSLGYLQHFGGDRLMIVKINPRDVVSIPSDYNDTKGRACRYEVVDEVDKDKADAALALAVQEAATEETSSLTPDERRALRALSRLVRVEELVDKYAADLAAAADLDDDEDDLDDFGR